MKTGKSIIAGAVAFLMATSLSVESYGHHGKGHRGKRRHHGRNHDGYHFNQSARRGDTFTRVYAITGADSLQRIKMKPLIDDAEKRIQSLRSTYRDQEASVMDSLKEQLKPFFKEDQIKKLEDVTRYK